MFLRAEPRPTSSKKRKKTTRKSPQNRLNIVPGGLRKPLPENIHKKTPQQSKKQPKMYNLGVPSKQGTNTERTNLWSHFCIWAPLGHPWGTPGGQNTPKNSPKSLWEPPRTSISMIFKQLFMEFRLFFIAFFVHFPRDFHTK